MKFLLYLASKKTDYLTNILLCVAALICLTQGVNNQTQILAYFSSFFLYFLVKRLDGWSSFVAGFILGACYGYSSFHWLSYYKDFTAFNLAIAFNGLLFSLILSGSNFFFKKFPKSIFIHIFAFGFIIFLIRIIFHYAPVMAYAKAFLTLVNTPTYFDWLVPVFGSSITDVMVLATGSLIALLYARYKEKKTLKKLAIYAFIFVLLLLIQLFNNYANGRDESKQDTVKMALLQGNYNWSWEDRIYRYDEILRYYKSETELAAKKGAKIVVWPEYAVPVDILSDRQEIREELKNLAKKEKVVIVAGSLELVTDAPNPNGKWTGYDISLVFDPQKLFLEPYRAIHPISDNVKVGTKRVIFNTNFASFPVISCFEVAYHRFVADYSNQNKSFDFLIGIANIQLFLGTDGAKRIQDHIRRIAMENGKYFIYVSNTGPSFVINPAGEFEHLIPSLTKKTLVVDIPKIKANSLYSNYQDLPLLLLFTLGFGAIYIHRRRK